MPVIKPSGGEVDWPENEGVLGIVGVAPWATIDFCKVLYERIRATRDWHYPRVIADINTKLPSRGRHLQLGEIDPSPAIAATIRELYAQGATVVVVPCNTAHILYERWSKDSPVPLPHIVRETLALAERAGIKSFTPFTSASLALHDLYGKLAGEFSLQCRRLNADEQMMVSSMIEDVKIRGAITNANLIKFDELITRLWAGGVEAAILGCTELSSLLDRSKKDGLKAFDSNIALAQAALKELHLSRHLLDPDEIFLKRGIR
ncbi:MAG: aspartate/glutamate racemase family protein [Proteobacteria bacterium]|nr:aspartate/glutamate racemase family protein [Pseudomonadota bacterium]